MSGLPAKISLKVAAGADNGGRTYNRKTITWLHGYREKPSFPTLHDAQGGTGVSLPK